MLARKILSALVQSTTCERLFSLFLWFHSKRRNRLGVKKVFYSVLGKKVVQRKDNEEERQEMVACNFAPGDVQDSKCI